MQHSCCNTNKTVIIICGWIGFCVHGGLPAVSPVPPDSSAAALSADSRQSGEDSARCYQSAAQSQEASCTEGMAGGSTAGHAFYPARLTVRRLNFDYDRSIKKAL